MGPSLREAFLHRWNSAQRTILTNASSIIGTTGLTSVLGAGYWLLAARQFPPVAVGLAAAAISAMTLLGTVGVLGLGTLLVNEFPRYPGREGSLICTALLASGLSGFGLGVLFAVIARQFFGDLKVLGSDLGTVGLFALGVSVTALTQVLDQALIGLLRGEIQFVRNAIFGVAKLGALFFAALWLEGGQGMTIYATWLLGNLLSVVILMVPLLRRGKLHTYLPQWGLLRGWRQAAVAHHALNLALQAPGSLLPLLVTVVLSAQFNASFYVAWMIVGVIFVGSSALTTVLHAAGVAARDTLPQKTRFTLAIAAVFGIVPNIVLLVGAGKVLQIFGHSYAVQATTGLRILGLAVFPLIIKNHYTAICRINNRISQATWAAVAGCVIEIIMAAVGGALGGLVGLCLGWLIAVSVEALFMAPVVYQTAFPRTAPPSMGGDQTQPESLDHAEMAARLLEPQDALTR